MFRYAFPNRTHELMLSTLALDAVVLIRVVSAVVVTVTHPVLVNAQSVSTLKLLRRTVCGSTAMGFIGIVATVIVSITEPLHFNTDAGAMTESPVLILIASWSAILFIFCVGTLHFAVAALFYRYTGA